LPDLELIPMPSGWALYGSGGHMSCLYSPTTGLVPLLYVMAHGSLVEACAGLPFQLQYPDIAAVDH
jgi:hypothetical protein